MDKAHEAEQFLWHRRFLYSHGGFYSLVGRNFHRLIRNHALFSIIFFYQGLWWNLQTSFHTWKSQKAYRSCKTWFFPCLMFLDHCLPCGQNFWMLQILSTFNSLLLKYVCFVVVVFFVFFKLKLTIFLCRIVDAKLGRLLCLLMGLGFYTAGFIKVIKWSFHFRVNNLWSAIEIYCHIRTVAEISRVFSSTSKQRKWRLFWN